MFLEMVCAWCKKFLGFKYASQCDKPLFYISREICISHGICLDCARKLRQQVKIAPQQNLETLKSNPALLRGAKLRPSNAPRNNIAVIFRHRIF
jgi:hypothetical protein